MATGVYLRDDRCLPYSRIFQKLFFNFSRFDAVASNLHLEIPPPDELDAAIRKPAAEVARAVKPPSSGIRRKCRNSALPPIAHGNRGTAQHDFPRAVDVHRFSGVIQ